jgi:hypothetical protein
LVSNYSFYIEQVVLSVSPDLYQILLICYSQLWGSILLLFPFELSSAELDDLCVIVGGQKMFDFDRPQELAFLKTHACNVSAASCAAA